MAHYVLSATIGLPGIAIDGRALYQFSQQIDRQLRDLEQNFGPPRQPRIPEHLTWERRKPKPK
ncbi:MAG: hypothetical protein KDA61_16570 [Planctomycetales bacterium]|nr:hypothetical protein [Planctomycetales bacterium]